MQIYADKSVSDIEMLIESCLSLVLLTEDLLNVSFWGMIRLY